MEPLTKRKKTSAVKNKVDINQIETGKIRVGRIVDRKNPKYEGFKNIVVMLPSTPGGWFPLSPYGLKCTPNEFKECLGITENNPIEDDDSTNKDKDEQYIMENVWQFSKVYKTVAKSDQKYSRYDHTVIWSWSEEQHTDEEGNIVGDAYRNWREAEFNNKYAVLRPIQVVTVGFKHKHECIYSLKELGGKRLDYVNARKEIYLPLYVKLAKKTKEFLMLKEMLANGINLLIIEVDGPHHR